MSDDRNLDALYEIADMLNMSASNDPPHVTVPRFVRQLLGPMHDAITPQAQADMDLIARVVGHISGPAKRSWQQQRLNLWRGLIGQLTDTEQEHLRGIEVMLRS